MVKILVEGHGFVKLLTDGGYSKWLKTKGFQFLIDDEKCEVVEFESLVDGGVYTFGPPLKHGEDHDDNAKTGRLKDIIKEQIAAMQRFDMAKRPIRVLSYTTKSQAYFTATIMDRILLNRPFFFPVIDLPVGFQTDAFQESRPDCKLDENKVHHPYFIQELEKLVNSFISASKGVNREASLRQKVLWSKSGKWLKLGDGTAGVAPDFCLQERESSDDMIVPSRDNAVLPQSQYRVTVALEQKKKITETDNLDAIDYGERLLIIQQPRHDSYVGLFQISDQCADIRWTHVFCQDNQFRSHITAPERLDISGGTGQRQLLTILSLTAADLGLNYPTFPHGYTGGCRLGEGATSFVYVVEKDGVQAVMKIFHPDYESYANYESSVVSHLVKHGVVGISGCEKVGPPTAIVFPDILARIEVVTSTNVEQLLDCLEGAHKAGVVHRDVRPENIMADSSGYARLIDWGCAHIKGAPIVRQLVGTFRYASEAVLEAAINREIREPKPEDDLESLVRVVLAINSVTIAVQLAELQQGNFVGARDFWRRKRTANARMESFFLAAAQCDYITLRELVFG